MKKTSPLLVGAVLGIGLVGAAQAHVSVGIGIGVPAYPVYAAPPPPGYYALLLPPPPAVVTSEARSLRRRVDDQIAVSVHDHAIREIREQNRRHHMTYAQ